MGVVWGRRERGKKMPKKEPVTRDAIYERALWEYLIQLGIKIAGGI